MQSTRGIAWFVACILVGNIRIAAAASPAQLPTTMVVQESPAAAIHRLSTSDIVRNPRPAIAELPALIRRAERDPQTPFADVAAARQTLAFAYAYDNDHARGIAELDALAADLKRRHVDGPLYDETLRRKAVLLSALKQYDDAAAIYTAILDREERAGRPSTALTSATLNGLAVVRARQGRYDDGEALGRRATAIGLTAPDAKPLAVGDAWRTWVVLLGLAGKSPEAIVEAQKSLRYNEQHQGEASESTVGSMNSLSSMLADVGRYAEAEAIQRRMIAIEARQTTTQGQTMAIWLGNFGTTLMAQGKAVEAEAVLRRARDLMLNVEHTQRPDFLGVLTLDLGVAVEAQGRRDEALALFQQAAVELARDAGVDHPSWAHAQSEIGRVLLDQGKPSAALEHMTLALAVMTKRLDRADHLRLTAELIDAEARLRLGDASGYASARRAIATERGELVNASLDPLRSALLARERVDSFTRFARLALDRGELGDAFEAVQLAQFGDLDSAGAAWVARQAAATPVLATLVRDLQTAAEQLKRLQATRTKAVAAANGSAVTDADRDIDAARTRSTALNARLNVEFPDYARLIRPEPRTLAAVRATLRPDDALVVTTPSGTNGIISLLVTRDQAKGVATTLPTGALQTWTMRLRASIDNALASPADAGFDAEAAYALFRAILPRELDRRASRASNLMMQASGVLASVPIAALLTAKPDGASLHGAMLRRAPWLVRRQAVSRPVALTTISAGAAPRRAIQFAAIGAPALQGPVATKGAHPAMLAGLLRGAVGGDDGVAVFPPLLNAERELRAMASELGDTTPLMLIGPAVTKANLLTQDLSPYSVIAFATHGLVGGELRNLTEPALVLTPGRDGSAEQDGLLTASEVARLRLDADWVILSACNTSAGEGGAAPIYTGLARAFVQAGARSLLLSHWPLRDDVAAHLTVATVRLAARGATRPQALRQAQLALINDRTIVGAAHPAVWAPLILIGD